MARKCPDQIFEKLTVQEEINAFGVTELRSYGVTVTGVTRSYGGVTVSYGDSLLNALNADGR
jgi:hypothetical protein